MAAGNTKSLSNLNSEQQFDQEQKETVKSESTKAYGFNTPKDPMTWIQNQISNGVDAKEVLHQLLPEITVPDHVNELSLWRLVFEILSELPPREQLKNINSIKDAIRLIKECKNIIILTGAGVSVSCGIPDFRSRDGIYARLSKDYPDLPDPQAMFDIHYFKNNPWPFFKFAKEIYPGQFIPSLCHRFIAHLDKQGKLLRNYTQNIDTLEQVAGIKNIVQCHGSFATASCTNCKAKVDADFIKQDIFDQKIPYCKQCTDEGDHGNILKPDIVFFGESLSEDFHKQIEKDKDKADLLIVIGSSLKVRPVALIPDLIDSDIPQILINREPLHHHQFDIEFFGNCDDIICELCHQLNGDYSDVIGSYKHKPLNEDIVTKLFENVSEYLGESNSSSTSNLSPNMNNKDSNSVNEEESNTYIQSATNIIENESKENILKRKIHKTEEKRKKQMSETNIFKDKEDLFYISIPPNRYIFHGAEFDYENASEIENKVDTEAVNNSLDSPDDMSILESTHP